MTNADNIRNMSDKDLAVYLEHIGTGILRLLRTHRPRLRRLLRGINYGKETRQSK